MSSKRVFTPIGRVSNRARLRAASDAVAENNQLKEQGGRLWVVLAAVLGELGGEIIVSEHSLTLVGREFATLDYVIKDGPEPGTSLVQLLQNGQPFVRNDEPPTDTRLPDLTITRVEES
jgi:hypothetical protein